jgi:hydroxyacylglutathione hydrolase
MSSVSMSGMTLRVYNRRMIHEILPVGMLQCNCSIFGDEETREAMVVDPGDEIARILVIVQRHGLTVKSIVITHAHIDHIGGAQKLKQATGAPVYMNANDIELQKMMSLQAQWVGVRTPEAVEIDVSAKDGDSLLVGATEFRVLHTPGHTQGSISLYIPSENKLVAGDTLFAGSIGRTDLPGGDHRMILNSIREKLLPLPEATVVIPGHGGETTIGEEKEFNPFLRE